MTIQSHYSQPGLVERVRNATEPHEPEWQHLAHLDHFHIRGLEATEELARLLAPKAGERVLDIGSGLGGPARYLAATLGVGVTGIDVTPPYVETANYLSHLVGLDSLTAFQVADATNLPFENNTFDHAWTLHVSMNVQDKARFFSEAFRVLKPGGRFVVYDPHRGSDGDLRFPVPWSSDAAFSFLASPEEARRQLTGAGFNVLSEEDKSARALQWFGEVAQSIQEDGTPKFSLALALGPDARTMVANVERNLRESRVRVTQFLAEKPVFA